MKTSDSTSASIAWTQTGISLAVLLAMLGVCGLIDLTARNGQLAAWVESRRLARWQQDNTTYQHAMGFVDFENRLLIDEIPRADYSRGGVYFVGSSTVVMSLMSWELPSEQRALIHNYGISGASHAQQFHFIRYLVEHEGLLAAGGEKTLVVLGLFYGNAAPTESGVNGQYIADLFRGQGLFAYSDAGGIEPAAGSGLPRELRFEKARCSNFLRRSVYNAGLSGDFNLGIRADVVPTPYYSRAERQEFWRRRMGGDWQTTMAREVEQLGRMIDYLHQRDARVAGVFLPLGSWHDDLPYATEYRRQVTSLCGKKSAPLLDLTTLLADDEFSDSVHFRYRGERKIHARLASLAVAYLQRAGALAPDALLPGTPVPGTREPGLLADDAGASRLLPAQQKDAPALDPAGAESPIVPAEFLEELETPSGSAR